jgi:hypothetical protein
MMMNDERRSAIEEGDVHPGNRSKENPFCGVAISPEGFVCDPV